MLSQIPTSINVSNRAEMPIMFWKAVGLSRNGTNVDGTAYLWDMAVRPVFTYGVQCVNIRQQVLLGLEKNASQVAEFCDRSA